MFTKQVDFNYSSEKRARKLDILFFCFFWTCANRWTFFYPHFPVLAIKLHSTTLHRSCTATGAVDCEIKWIAERTEWTRFLGTRSNCNNFSIIYSTHRGKSRDRNALRILKMYVAWTRTCTSHKLQQVSYMCWGISCREEIENFFLFRKMARK